MRYADDVFKTPDYHVYNSPAEKNGRGGDLLHLHGRTGTNVGRTFTLTEKSGNRWLIFTTLDSTVIPADAEIDIFCVYEGFSEMVKLPACTIIKRGAIRTADDHILTDSLAQNGDICFERRPARSVPEHMDDETFNCLLLNELRKNDPTNTMASTVEMILKIDESILTDDRMQQIINAMNINPEAIDESVSGFLSKFKTQDAAKEDVIRTVKEMEQFIAITTNTFRLSERKRFLLKELLGKLLIPLARAAELYTAEERDYVARKYSETQVFRPGCFTMNVPKDWHHKTQGNFDYFFGNTPGRAEGGYLCVNCFTEQHEKQDLQGYYETILRGMSSVHDLQYGLCEIAGQTGMRFSMIQNGKYVSGFMVHFLRRTLTMMYMDPEAERADIDRMASFIADSVRPAPDRVAPDPAPVFRKSAASPVKLSPVGERRTVCFGRYPQTAKGEAESIEWIVLEERGPYLLLLSRQALDALPYTDRNMPVIWANCALRQWLNEDFYAAAFSERERSAITSTACENRLERNTAWNTEAGGLTGDRVFLLSHHQVVNQYFPDPALRKCGVTPFLLNRDSSMVNGDGCAWWWLRSPGKYQNGPEMVLWDGRIDYDIYDGCSGAIRPAVWVDTSKL